MCFVESSVVSKCPTVMLQSKYLLCLEELEPLDITDRLYAQDILTEEDNITINGKSTRRSRVITLLDILFQKEGDVNVDIIANNLVESQNEHLAKELRKGDNTGGI